MTVHDHVESAFTIAGIRTHGTRGDVGRWLVFRQLAIECLMARASKDGGDAAV